MTEPDPKSGLPRFDMPLGLALFQGARKFGGKTRARRQALIFDRELHRYRALISNIAGQDNHAHGRSPARLVETVATWLRREARGPGSPGRRAIAEAFFRFQEELRPIAAERILAQDREARADA